MLHCWAAQLCLFPYCGHILKFAWGDQTVTLHMLIRASSKNTNTQDFDNNLLMNLNE